MHRTYIWIAVASVVVSGCTTATAPEPTTPAESPEASVLAGSSTTSTRPAPPSTTTTTLPAALSACVEGQAGRYPCAGLELLADLSFEELGGVAESDLATDLWGWTQPETGREVVIFSLARGTAFVEITDPANPELIGFLAVPGNSDLVPLQDIKVYADHAFIVGETPGHGMQVVDLAAALSDGSVSELANYQGFDTAHNLAIDTESGFAYAIGGDTCGGGLVIVDITDPIRPTPASCFDEAGPLHDAQCVVYDGPDRDYTGRQVCFAAGLEKLVVIDVTNKSGPLLISSETYGNVGYTHQGGLSADQRWFFLGDEFDESNTNTNTRTLVWDLEDLDEPIWIGDFVDELGATNHNIFVVGSLMYQANYEGGLRIFDVSDPGSLLYPLVGWFDTYPSRNSSEFNGAFGVYPYFPSGVIAISNMGTGLLLVRPTPNARNRGTNGSP